MKSERKKYPSRGGYPWRRLLVTFVAAALLCLLYSLIFHFSAQDSGESGSLSRMLSEKCVAVLNFLAGSPWDAAEAAQLAGQFEYPLRKMAHFSEYACMGLLVSVMGSQWMAQGWRLRLLTVLWVFLSAAGDEYHQYFVPGRCASAADVLLDTCGGAGGMLFHMAVRRLCGTGGKKRRKAGSAGKGPVYPGGG